VFTCFFVRRWIDAYLDGALDERRAGRVAAHLAGCASCEREAASLRRLRSLLQQNLTLREPDWTGFWPGVVRGIETTRRERSVPRPRRRWAPRWALGSGLAAAVVASLAFWQVSPWLATPDIPAVVVSSAETEDPEGAIMIYAPERDMAVVWLVSGE
jgi:anti-sigma factor RsiW